MIYIQISVSAGVAVGAALWSSLFKKADKHLFRAKALGRNAVAGDLSHNHRLIWYFPNSIKGFA